MLIILVLIFGLAILSALDRDSWPEPEERRRTHHKRARSSMRKNTRRPASRGFLSSSRKRPHPTR